MRLHAKCRYRSLGIPPTAAQALALKAEFLPFTLVPPLPPPVPVVGANAEAALGMRPAQSHAPQFLSALTMPEGSDSLGRLSPDPGSVRAIGGYVRLMARLCTVTRTSSRRSARMPQEKYSTLWGPDLGAVARPLGPAVVLPSGHTRRGGGCPAPRHSDGDPLHTTPATAPPRTGRRRVAGIPTGDRIQ